MALFRSARNRWPVAAHRPHPHDGDGHPDDAQPRGRGMSNLLFAAHATSIRGPCDINAATFCLPKTRGRRNRCGPLELSAASMRTLRAMHNEIPLALRKRDGQLTGWAISTANGLVRGRVDQIIRENHLTSGSGEVAYLVRRGDGRHEPIREIRR